MVGPEFNKHIAVTEGFQSSVNVGFDFNNHEKVKNFIATRTSLEIIEDLMLSTADNSNDRARILIGAYGKGKSHMLLVFLALLTYKDPTLFSNLLPKIKEYNSDLYNYVLDYLDSDKKLLPVIIQGSNTSLSQSFLGALQKTLEDEGLEDLMPDTHFEAALDRIEEWKQNFPNTYLEFILKLDQPINDFILRLLNYDIEAYQQFTDLYPTLTAGSQFNPFLNLDVIELYTNVIEKLKGKGFSGIFVLYDEFSKFLEADIAKVSSVEMKLLQDFAEKCNRSKDKQLHLLLVSHKDISNYIDELPKQKVDGWKGVSERFKHVEVRNDFTQIYEIMSTVIEKDEEYFEKFYKYFSARFISFKDYLVKTTMFSELEEDMLDTVVYGCYPLHPVSSFILPRLSERVAQNERTLFSFLSAPQKNTLPDFLEKVGDRFPIITPDFIYDYFEPLFKKEPYTSDIYKTYILTSDILTKLERESLCSKLVKTIFLIYITNQFERLAPTPEVLVYIFRESVSDISEITTALAQLQEKEYVIYLKRSNNYLRLKNSTSVDVGRRISDLAERVKATKGITSILNEMQLDNYMYPTKYNDDNAVTRYFNFLFIESEEFLAVENWEKKIENVEGEGVIYGIIPANEEEIISIREALKDAVHQRIVFTLPYRSPNIVKIIYEYQAAKQIEKQIRNDTALMEEVGIYLEDLEEVIELFRANYFQPEQNQVEYYYQGEKQHFHRKAQMSQLLSTICQKVFYKAPIINNEVIYKDFPSGAAISGRDRVLEGLLNNQLQPNLGLVGSGQDTSIMRSTLIMTGILKGVEDRPKLHIADNEDPKIQNVLDVISSFFKSSSRGKLKNFGKLYELLTSPNHHIGLKRGVIPIYIAVVLHFYKQHIVIIRDRRELEISVELLNSINENPEEYEVCLEEWNEDKAAYISALETIFEDDILVAEKEYNTFSYIVRAMQRWFRKLPPYAKEMKHIYLCLGKFEKIDKEKLRFAASLKAPELNPHEYLFEKVLSFFGQEAVSLTIAEKIVEAKIFFDNVKNSLIENLRQDIWNVFKKGQDERSSLISIIKDWYEGLGDSTQNHLFSSGAERVLELMKNIDNDEKQFIERLARELTGVRIDDWDDELVLQFNRELKDFKNAVEAYDDSCAEVAIEREKNFYCLTFIDDEGNEHRKTFEKAQYSDTTTLLVNEINAILDEYGEALSNGQKRQVLIDIIQKIS